MVRARLNQEEFKMARNLDPKCKRCRREGEKLFLKGDKCFTPKCPIIKRNYPPGMHGPKFHGQRLTQYGTQLREKQKVKHIYGILEKQFSNYVQKAMKGGGDSGANLLNLLELRLDNVIYRIGLAKSRSIARQLVSHNHILVNNKTVNIPSAQLKVGDQISIKERSKNLFSEIEKNPQKQTLPGWLEYEQKKMAGKVLSKPPFDEVKQTLNIPIVIEFYSR